MPFFSFLLEWLKTPGANRTQQKQKQKIYLKSKEILVGSFIQLCKKGEKNVVTYAPRFFEVCLKKEKKVSKSKNKGKV